MPTPDIRSHDHESKLLRGNPMGDDHVRRLPVYVPPGYDEDRAEPYPVVYLLAGWSGRGARYFEDGGAFSVSLPERFDRMIAAGEMRPFVAAFPDCTTKLGASQYVNSAANGPYMDYLCDELVPFVESLFNVRRDAAYRGLLGHSSGGFGALVTAMLRPDAFRAICSSAGDGWYEHLYVEPIPKIVRAVQKKGGVVPFIEAYLASPNPFGLLPSDDGIAMMSLGMCNCYAPNLDVPVLKGDLYFDLDTGELVPEVWAKFLAWDPVLMVERHLDALRSMRWIHLEAGTEDEYGLHLAHRQLARRMRDGGLAPVVDEYPGKHGGHHYRFADRIRRLLDALYT
jgi:enterochelin esterase-like enzyme